VEEKRHNGLAPFVVAALVLAAATHLWWLIASLHRASYASGLSHTVGGFYLADAQARDHEVQHALIGAAVAELLAGVLFIIWLFRLVSDVDRRRPGTLRYSTGWAIGGWFVPLLNLVRPKQVVDDAWRSASPASAWATTSPWWIQAWWASWVIAKIVFFFSRFQGTESLAAIVQRDRTIAVACAIDIVCAAFAMMTVVSLSNRAVQLPAVGLQTGRGQHGMRFNPAPGWPVPPVGWAPPVGWKPDPAWPAAPPGWRFWIP
jgi:hypothetical protein